MIMGAETPLRLLRHANIADAILLAPFAVPMVSDFYLRLWSSLNEAAGGQAFARFDPTHLVFVNLVGLFALFGVFLRVRWQSTPLAFSVGVLKLAASAIFAFALVNGGARVFAVPLVVDLIMGALLIKTAHAHRITT